MKLCLRFILFYFTLYVRVFCVGIQTLDKQLRCRFYQGLPASLSPYQRGMAGIYPPSDLSFPAQSLGFPSPRGSSVYNSDILIFFPLSLLSPSPFCLCTLASLPLPLPFCLLLHGDFTDPFCVVGELSGELPPINQLVSFIWLELAYFVGGKYLSFLFACMSVYQFPAWYLRRSEEGIWSCRTGVRDGCKPLCTCWDLSLRPLQEQEVL